MQQPQIFQSLYLCNLMVQTFDISNLDYLFLTDFSLKYLSQIIGVCDTDSIPLISKTFSLNTLCSSLYLKYVCRRNSVLQFLRGIKTKLSRRRTEGLFIFLYGARVLRQELMKRRIKLNQVKLVELLFLTSAILAILEQKFKYPYVLHQQ